MCLTVFWFYDNGGLVYNPRSERRLGRAVEITSAGPVIGTIVKEAGGTTLLPDAFSYWWERFMKVQWFDRREHWKR